MYKENNLTGFNHQKNTLLIWHSVDLSTHLAGVQVPCMFVSTVGLTGLHVEPGTACPKSNLQALRVHSSGSGVYSGL